MLGHTIMAHYKRMQRKLACPGFDAYKYIDEWTETILHGRAVLIEYYEKYIKFLKGEYNGSS